MSKDLYIKMINLSREELIKWLIEEIEDNDRFIRLLNDLSRLDYCTKHYYTKDGYGVNLYRFKDLSNAFFIAERIGDKEWMKIK